MRFNLAFDGHNFLKIIIARSRLLKEFFYELPGPHFLISFTIIGLPVTGFLIKKEKLYLCFENLRFGCYMLGKSRSHSVAKYNTAGDKILVFQNY